MPHTHNEGGIALKKKKSPMCTYYWNLQPTLRCPNCSQTATWKLQTHYMGDIVSYANVYKLGQRVKELAGGSVLLDRRRILSESARILPDRRSVRLDFSRVERSHLGFEALQLAG